MTSSARRRRTRLLAVTALTAGLALATTASAQAHVRVHADTTTTGSFSALTFRVPNESPTESTVEVSVQLPQDRPFVYVSSKPVPGWKVVSTEETLPKPVDSDGTTITKAVRTVTWTAEKGGGVAPGEYQEFSLSVGPLPEPGTILLPAAQTYSDGKVVSWSQPTPAGGDEPESPAPELVVTAASSDPSPTSPSATEPPATTSAATDGAARGLAAGALAVAVAALVAAGIGLRRRAAGPTP